MLSEYGFTLHTLRLTVTVEPSDEHTQHTHGANVEQISGPPRRRRTPHDACSAALRNRARPLARATPATDEEVSSGRRTHDLWRRAAHLRARSELLLAHMAAACPPLLC